MKIFISLLFAIAIVGCKKGGYDQSLMAKLTAPEQKIVGKYKLEMDFTSGGAEAQQFKELLDVLASLESGETTLECFPDKTYVMLVGDVRVKGGWKLGDNLVQLRIENVGDMKPEQISRVERKNAGISGWSMDPKQREEFLKAHANSIALERAESMATMRTGVDGALYAAGDPQASIFGSMISYFKRVPEP